MKKLSFEEFTPLSLVEWKKLVLKELGGKPYESIQWINENGVIAEPYYVNAGPQGTPELNPPPRPWIMHQDNKLRENTGTPASREELIALNKRILQSLAGGMNSIGILEEIDSMEVLDTLLENVQYDIISIDYYTDDP